MHLRLPSLCLLLAAGHTLIQPAAAKLRTPYTADASTVYLFHFDEAAGASSAANAGTAGFAAISYDGDPATTDLVPEPVSTVVLGAAGLTGFGNAANISAADLGLAIDADGSGSIEFGTATVPSLDAVQQSALSDASGSFSIDALVNVPAITGAQREIVCTDNSTGTRGFQFRINTGGNLEFNFISTPGAAVVAAIPTTGTHAFAANEWFHVAVTHDALTSTTRLYWTRVQESSSEANQIGISTTETVNTAVNSQLVLGNEGRAASGEGLRGLLDQVRISSVVRAPDQFIFVASDSDGDGMDDDYEIAQWGNLAQTGTADFDGDGFSNLEEFTARTDPKNPAFTPADTDGDGLADAWEITNFGSLTTQDGSGDRDADFATNEQEETAGTLPLDYMSFPDADLDGMSDGWETQFGLNPAINDAASDKDADTFTNLQEFTAHSAPDDAAWTPEKAKLLHRWSFNGSLDDSVGTSPAVIVDPDANAAAGGAATLAAQQVTLAGGAQGTSEYVNLGTSLLNGRRMPVTLELWATQDSVQTWSRIFDFGSGTTENLFMSWTRGTAINTDRVEWLDNVSSIGDSTNQPYTTGQEFHIVMTIEPGKGAGNDTSLVTWYSAATNAPMGAAKGSFSTRNTLAEFTGTVMALGRSHYAADLTANASYNEVRLWAGALTASEISSYHVLGADSLNAADADGDGLLDEWEITHFGSIAAQNGSGDPDDDLFTNAEEYTAGTNPAQQISSPDTDADGLPDGWEVKYFRQAPADLLADIIARSAAGDDPDADTYTNQQEFAAGSSPVDALFTPVDTDGDLLPDAWELEVFASIAAQNGNGDADSDGATNRAEYLAGSRPAVTASTPADTDGDGIPDISEVLRPYTADAATLHLWHFNDLTAPAADAGADPLPLTAAAGGATLWTPSMGGFGTALATKGVTAAGLAALPVTADTSDNVFPQLAGPDGAFSMEALVFIGFDPAAPANPAAPMEILSAEGDVNEERVFQFRILPTAGAPVLQFTNLNGSTAIQTIAAAIPVSGSHAITQGAWFHAAVTYDGAEGTDGNIRLYWTSAADTSTRANLISSATDRLNADLIAPATGTDFMIGNEARNASGEVFFGLIDEVRISSVARAATQFFFVNPADSDGDGMDDAWELTHFGSLAQTAAGDFDADGTNNGAEFRLGLLPASGSSRFVTGFNGATLSWPSVPGLAFTVQSSPDLSAWTDVQTVSAAAGAVTTFTVPGGQPAPMFYRVRLRP